MPQPLPAYLIALAIGDIEFRAISERCGVYGEKGMADAAAWEFDDTERMMQIAESDVRPVSMGSFRCHRAAPELSIRRHGESASDLRHTGARRG